jgi:threonine dehydratase
MTLPVAFADVRTAADRLSGVAHRTPVLSSRSLDERLNAKVFFKAEHLQRMGAFKFRGAYNALAQFSAEQRKSGVIAYSSGNHAQATALAARLLGMPSVIVMPQDAPAIKLAATRGYQEGQPGSEVVLYDRYTEDREAIGKRIAAERGMTLIPPFDHPHVVAGQGTAALELMEDTGPLDLLVVCVGGGGLISGCAIAASAMSPDCRVVGVEPAAGNDVQQSLAAGTIISIATPKTIADGAQTQACGRVTFPIMQSLVSEIVTVGDEQLIRTMRWFAGRMKQVIEPTGCLAAAAVLEGIVPVAGKRVGVILSGGNVDPVQFSQYLVSSPG